MNLECEVPGCGNMADLQYDVDPSKRKRICSLCMGKHTPLTLDTLLAVRQKDYGIQNPEVKPQT